MAAKGAITARGAPTGLRGKRARGPDEQRAAAGAAGRAAILLTACAVCPAAPADERLAPFVPTVREDVDLMLDIADVGPGDYLIDLGSGDGRIVIEAAERGAFGHGVEIDGELVERAERNAREAGVEERVVFEHGDARDAELAGASVVTMYLFPEGNLELRPKLLSELRPGTRVLSNSFDMGAWTPDVHDMSARSSGGILMWTVPADVAGEWRLTIDGEDEAWALNVEQQYQQIAMRMTAPVNDGARASPQRSSEIERAALHGDRLVFRTSSPEGRYAFNGRVDGDSINGFVQIRDDDGSRVTRWRARR